VKHVNLILCNFSNVLATRQQGAAARALLRERMADEPAHLIINFTGVDAVAPPFIDELLEEVYATLRRFRDSGMLLIVFGANEDDRETIKLVLERDDRPGLAYIDKGHAELLSDSPQLVETLRAARQLGRTFTAPQLGEVLNLKLPAVNHRLARLHAAGAIGRRRDDAAERGIRYLYDAPTEEVLRDLVAEVGHLRLAN
jgi:hypothetical protein